MQLLWLESQIFGFTCDRPQFAIIPTWQRSHRGALFLTACRAVRLERRASNELTYMRDDADADVYIINKVLLG